MTAAGKFWLAYLSGLILAAGLVFSMDARAGYYATITASNYGPVLVGRTSSCALTVGIAIQQASNVTTSVSGINTDTGAFTAYYATSPSSNWSGVFGSCVASPVGGTIPNYVGGVQEPAYVTGGVSVGGGSGGSSADLTLLTSTVAALQTELAAVQAANTANSSALGNVQAVLNEPFDLTTGMAAFAFFFSTTIFFYGFSRGAGAVLEMVRRPMGRG